MDEAEDGRVSIRQMPNLITWHLMPAAQRLHRRRRYHSLTRSPRSRTSGISRRFRPWAKLVGLPDQMVAL